MKRGLPERTTMESPRRSFDVENHFLSTVGIQGASQANVPVDQIRTNPKQPRRDSGDLTELTDSIRKKGVLEPIIVRRAESGYEIVAGERRFRAFMASGREEKDVPCVVVEADDREALEISLVENLQRKDLDIWEEAETYRLMSEKLGYTQEEIASKIGKSIGYVNGRMGVARLPAEARETFSKFEDVPQHLVLQAVKAEKAGKLDEYTEMVGSGKVASAKEAEGAVKHLTKKRNKAPKSGWRSFAHGEFQITTDRRGAYLVMVKCQDKKYCVRLIRYIQGAEDGVIQVAQTEPKKGTGGAG